MDFRILSLDSGGIKGAFTAGCLAALEWETGRCIMDHFDLVTWTSNLYLYGDQAAGTIARETPLWEAWFQKCFPAKSAVADGN